MLVLIWAMTWSSVALLPFPETPGSLESAPSEKITIYGCFLPASVCMARMAASYITVEPSALTLSRAAWTSALVPPECRTALSANWIRDTVELSGRLSTNNLAAATAASILPFMLPDESRTSMTSADPGAFSTLTTLPSSPFSLIVKSSSAGDSSRSSGSLTTSAICAVVPLSTDVWISMLDDRLLKPP